MPRPTFFGFEGFESGSSPWSFDSLGTIWGNSSSTLDNTAKIEGNNSIALNSTGEGSAGAIKTLGSSYSNIYVQTKILFPSDFDFNLSTYINLIVARDSSSNGLFNVTVEKWGTSIRLTLRNNVTSSWSDTSIVLPRGEAITMEYNHTFNEASGRQRMWINNTNIDSPNYDSGLINSGVAGINKLIYGIAYTTGAHSTFYMDQMAASGSFIGDGINSSSFIPKIIMF